MIQLVAIAALGAVGLYAYGSFRKHMDALEAQDREKAKTKREPKSALDLEHDPKTGRYKLKK